MRPPQLVLLMLITLTATTAAQSRVVVFEPQAELQAGSAAGIALPTAVATHASPDDMVARLMSFDRNGDGKVARDEVLERMENVVTRGDVSGDGVLDWAEANSLANQRPAPVVVRGFQAGQYSFGDESSLSSRFHIEGALEDLRLASPAKEEALAIVKTFVDTLEATASARLSEEMGSLLTTEQMARFKVVLDRLSQPQRMMTMVSGPNRAASQTDTMTQLRVFVFMDPTRQIAQFKLPPPENAAALAAIDRFKKQLRPDEAGRSALLDQLQDILGDEERDNFRAALERRPVIKAGTFIAVNGVQGQVIGGVVQGGIVGGLVPPPVPDR